jgi:plasmid stabilization system protein ParE
MGLNVRLDDRAASDLNDIRSYLVERSPQGAERVRRHIEATIDQLSDFPFLGRATDEPSVRVLPLTRYPYVIFYTVIADEVVILHVRHGARRPIDPGQLTKD